MFAVQRWPEEVKQHGSKSKDVVAKCGVKKEVGYLYFLDKDGDVSRAKMVRGGRRKSLL